jgi:hypothetical protein
VMGTECAIWCLMEAECDLVFDGGRTCGLVCDGGRVCDMVRDRGWMCGLVHGREDASLVQYWVLRGRRVTLTLSMYVLNQS